jgi:NitT/TauT family transport system ATP-binding protein
MHLKSHSAKVTETTLIEAQAVGMTFPGGQAALRDVDLQVQPGEFVSLVGPSGCGKSTLLRMIAGLVEPTAGQLTLAGLPPLQARREAQRVAFVFQDPTLLPWRNVADNIRLPLQLQKVPRARHAEPIRESLKLIGLSDADARKYPRMLSGGMRMRVSLARALVTQPDVLLLDEPFAALDDIMRQQLNEELSRIWIDRRPTALFVTHNVSEAVFLSQRIVVMSSSPGTVVSEVDVPFPFPRRPELRAETEFARLAGEVSLRLRGISV